MHVLVATADSQGAAPDDFCHTIEGELVWLVPPCGDPDCGCDREMGGLGSHQGTNTVRVIDRPDMTIENLITAIADSATAQGYEWLFRVTDLAVEEARALTRIAESMEPDGVLERRGDFMLRRFFSHQVGWVALRSESYEAKGQR